MRQGSNILKEYGLTGPSAALLRWPSEQTGRGSQEQDAILGLLRSFQSVVENAILPRDEVSIAQRGKTLPLGLSTHK